MRGWFIVGDRMSGRRASGRARAGYRLSLLIVAAAAMAGSATARAHRSRAAAPAVRRWGGIWIEPLDVSQAGVRAAGSGNQAKPPAGRNRVLSNERTFTRWAYVAEQQAIYRQPSATSPRVERLHWYTEDGFSEVYLLLRARWDQHGQEWVKLRIPGRPNGQTGWVRRGALGAFHVTHSLVVVDRGRLRMYFYYYGHRRWSAPVGVGKPGTPTPAGHFWIRERFKILDPSNGYYPYAFGTADYSTLTDWPGGGVVGIHGPYGDPQGIPGQISHGCIRLEVADDFWLAGHVGVGTPVHVI